MLTLWVIGTYFYTMFPAYPYLALNGPKNSSKSTVLRVTQPLAFNMVNTSDPTGPSMFRLIYTTSCTVGIDEAERYHNPRDPGMQQIRQLLNSGYKAGMPAIRVTGDDLKPQVFDVYSPKILAAIAGLEDVLANRCIAIPMRRTDRKMTPFPADFDAAAIRHQLYTLALTHFAEVYRNYFERPKLHTLHNRSGELWSPLVALAAFFEERGSLSGLLDAVSRAAKWYEQVSEGKALSDREEAVVQVLEVMTRSTSEISWLKASALREEVARPGLAEVIVRWPAVVAVFALCPDHEHLTGDGDRPTELVNCFGIAGLEVGLLRPGAVGGSHEDVGRTGIADAVVHQPAAIAAFSMRSG